MCCLNAGARRELKKRRVPSIGRIVLSVILLGSLALPIAAQTPPAPEDKVEKKFYSAKDRLRAIQQASIFHSKPVNEADLMAGPTQDKDEFQLHLKDKVICDFATPGSQMGGNTPKFACKITRVESKDGDVQVLNEKMKEEPVKVKFGRDNNEIYAELAASRLLWALGFYSDAWYPVQVECHDCPEDPESGKGAKQTRTFDPVIVVRKLKGHKMFEVGKDDEGWSWKELAEANASPGFERDALALLGAFIVHSDNKPPQQRLTCAKVTVDQTTHPFTTTCDSSKMVVQDVGATFGGGGLFTNNDSAKMNLGKWTDSGLWKKVGKDEANAPACQARLRKSAAAKDGLGDPMISEEGRRLLAGLMCQLSDGQISDLFKSSRVAQKPEYHNPDGSFKSNLNEESIVQQWVSEFKQKREDLAAGRCQWKAKPADLKLVDNPAGLATVPNFCSAHPF